LGSRWADSNSVLLAVVAFELSSTSGVLNWVLDAPDTGVCTVIKFSSGSRNSSEASSGSVVELSSESGLTPVRSESSSLPESLVFFEVYAVDIIDTWDCCLCEENEHGSVHSTLVNGDPNNSCTSSLPSYSSSSLCGRLQVTSDRDTGKQKLLDEGDDELAHLGDSDNGVGGTGELETNECDTGDSGTGDDGGGGRDTGDSRIPSSASSIFAAAAAAMAPICFVRQTL